MLDFLLGLGLFGVFGLLYSAGLYYKQKAEERQSTVEEEKLNETNYYAVSLLIMVMEQNPNSFSVKLSMDDIWRISDSVNRTQYRLIENKKLEMAIDTCLHEIEASKSQLTWLRQWCEERRKYIGRDKTIKIYGGNK